MHTPVLLHESIEGLDPQNGDVFVDCTVGFGGHAKKVLEIAPQTKIVGIDLDERAIGETKTLLESLGADYLLFNESFRNIDKVLDEAGFSCANKFLFDLGISSYQIDKSGRGFTFMRDEPLVMTIPNDLEEVDFTAETIVNEWAEDSIADIIYGYGEERFARRIAKKIVEAREERPIKTTFELRDIIVSAIPDFAKSKRLHPATKTFQAIRIAVNDELGSAKEGLRKAFERLCPRGRIAVISFHSLEDRIVKRYFKELEKSGLGKNLYKKPLEATEEEIRENPRSRSAKLRIFIKN